MTLWLNLRARVAHCPEFTNGFDFDFSAYRLILGIIEKIVAEADRKNLGQ